MTSLLDKQTGLPRRGWNPFDFTISTDLFTRGRKQIPEIIFSISSKHQSMFSQEYSIGCQRGWEPSIKWYFTQCVSDTLYGAKQTACSAWTPGSCTSINMGRLNRWTNAINYGYVKKEGRIKIQYPCFCNIRLISVIEPEARITSLIPLLRESSKRSR